MTNRVNTQKVELELSNKDVAKLEYLAGEKNCTVESLIETLCVQLIVSSESNTGVKQEGSL